MDTTKKRKFSKFAVKTIVTGVSGKLIANAVLSAFPATEKLDAADIIGALGGYYVGDKLEPHTDKMVDTLFDKYEAKHSDPFTDPN